MHPSIETRGRFSFDRAWFLRCKAYGGSSLRLKQEQRKINADKNENVVSMNAMPCAA